MGQSDQRFPLGFEELQRFHRDGYIGPFDLYDPSEIEAQLRALRPELLSTKNTIRGSAKSASGVTSLSSYDRHIEIEFLARHITHTASRAAEH